LGGLAVVSWTLPWVPAKGPGQKIGGLGQKGAQPEATLHDTVPMGSALFWYRVRPLSSQT
jgi:hypothetical protein